jgi:hypothetical protein
MPGMDRGIDMVVTSDWIIKIVLFSIAHWVLAAIMLNDLSSRKKVFGGRKAPWAVVILAVPGFGSLVYLLFHPHIFNPDRDGRDD